MRFSSAHLGMKSRDSPLSSGLLISSCVRSHYGKLCLRPDLKREAARGGVQKKRQHVCPQRPYRLLSLTKARPPEIAQNTGLPDRGYRELAISGFPFADDKTQKAAGLL